MYQHILIRNKQIYHEYNEFRKQLFSESSPKDSETILYLLPWLLSINHPSCPGYVSGSKKTFRVFGIDNHKEIMKREKTFKWKFGIRTKASLLKILLDSPYNLLICHQFRERVLGREKDSIFLDPSIFTMSVILNFYKTKRNKKTLTFLTECFYLRCEIKPYEKNENLNKKLSNQLFKNFHIDMKTRITLSRFSSWNFREQMELGKRLFDFIIKQYHEITKAHAGIAGKSDQKDLTILGRKIAASYQNKKYKVPFIHRPSMRLNYPDIILSLSPDNTWRVFLDGNRKFTLVSSKSIVYCISFIVWNNLFEINRLYMEPNPSEVTIQEVINLSCKIRDFVGGSDISGNEFHYYLKKERITKMLVVISFEQSSWDKNINNFSILYKNSWGELFVKQFHSHQKFKSFLLDSTCNTRDIEINHYLQRNCNCYEKIIEKAKKTITPLF